jgi:hypothetical protein
LVWFGLVWFGLVWFGLVWFDLVWFGLVWLFVLLLFSRDSSKPVNTEDCAYNNVASRFFVV